MPPRRPPPRWLPEEPRGLLRFRTRECHGTVGGLSKPALRRAIAQGNGWLGFNVDLETTANAVRGLEAMAREVERPHALGPLDLSVAPPPGPIDLGLLRAYEDLGVEHIVVMRSARDMVGQPDVKGEKLADALDFPKRNAETLRLGRAAVRTVTYP